MSDFSVYEDEMSNRAFSDVDVERFFSGEMPEDEALAELAPKLRQWHAQFAKTPTDEQVMKFAIEASKIVTSAPTEPVEQASARPPSSGRKLVRALKYKLATGLAAVMLLSGMTGVAVASDEAAPGDALYGLDRALEVIGINDGATAERIQEAQALLEAGRITEAVEHAAEAAEETDGEATEAAEALLAAAERLRANENASENALAVHESVAEMLQYISESESKGKGFGQYVSAMAKGIGGPDNPAALNAADQKYIAQSGDKPGNGGANKASHSQGNGNKNGEPGPPEGVEPGPPDDKPKPPGQSRSRP